MVRAPAGCLGRRRPAACDRRGRGRLPDPETPVRCRQHRRDLHPEEKPQRKDTTVDWPLYGLNRARTRYLPTKGLNPPFRMLWHFDAGQLLEFSPIVVRSTVYVMSNDAKVFAINSETGNIKWKTRIGELSASSPAFAHKRLYVTTLEPGQPSRSTRRPARSSGAASCRGAPSPRRSSRAGACTSAPRAARCSRWMRRKARSHGRSRRAAT